MNKQIIKVFNDPAIPDYKFIPGVPDELGRTGGCNGCVFRFDLNIRCSRIPCQKHPGMIAQLISHEQRKSISKS